MLSALIGAPSFDPLFRAEVIRVPAEHPTYRWGCSVPGCRRAQSLGHDFCSVHIRGWAAERDAGGDLPRFIAAAQPMPPWRWQDDTRCGICPDLPASSRWGLCIRHQQRWNTRRRRDVEFEVWCAGQRPLPGYGSCVVVACPDLACSPVGLCVRHQYRYDTQGRPGGAVLPKYWGLDAERPVVGYADRAVFGRWCRESDPVGRNNGQLSLLGLRPLVLAEIQWLLFRRTCHQDGAGWPLPFVQQLVNRCRGQRVNSLLDADIEAFPETARRVGRAMLAELRVLYCDRQDTRRCGFLETDHFGVRFTQRGSHIDLSPVPQEWLRNLLWDWMAMRLSSARPPRSKTPFDVARRGCLELGSFLRACAPGGGDDPGLLREQDAVAFIADQRHRARGGLPALGIHRRDGTKTVATPGMVATTFDGARIVLRAALESGASDRIGLDRAFIVAIPNGGHAGRRRRPFPDEVARALAEPANLDDLAGRDSDDRGLRDIWEALIVTGRRASEIRQLRLECLGRYNGLPMLWHDQTKVNSYDQAIRIPEPLHQRLTRRQDITIGRFHRRYGRAPTPAERAQVALFPRRAGNRDFTQPVSAAWFNVHFRAWVDRLDIGRWVPHQARHTLATSLLRNGASLTHVKRYLGQVSERMAEHYVHLANTDPVLEDALNAIWVAGPAAAHPGEILSAGTTAMSRQQAEALAVDLTRRSTPAEGGFCTYQPVVGGQPCPFNLNCHGCQKFVLSGADLLYWRRKREQWTTLAERAPDPATADYLHQSFAPTARAIDGLEKALTAAGLLDQALALDLRRPQDYFARVWSLAFRSHDLANHDDPTHHNIATHHHDDVADAAAGTGGR